MRGRGDRQKFARSLQNRQNDNLKIKHHRSTFLKTSFLLFAVSRRRFNCRFPLPLPAAVWRAQTGACYDTPGESKSKNSKEDKNKS
jgi:hypothetical protein